MRPLDAKIANAKRGRSDWCGGSEKLASEESDFLASATEF